MNASKKMLRDRIEELQDCIIIEQHIRDCVEKFRHHKQVNKRFFDFIMSCRTYYVGCRRVNGFNVALRNKQECWGKVDFEFDRDVCMSWDLIIQKLEKHRYAQELQATKEALGAFDEELEKLTEIYEMLENTKFKCFSLSRSARALQLLINEVK